MAKFQMLGLLVGAVLAVDASGASLVPAQTSVSLSASAGGSGVGSTSVNVTASSGALAFSAAATTQSGGSWLTVFSNSSTTPATLTIRAIPGSLAANTYRGTINLTCTGTGAGACVSVAISVTFTVTPPISITCPATLNSSNDSCTLSPQPLITITATQNRRPFSENLIVYATVPFTLSASTQPGSGNWLSVSCGTPPSQTCPANPSGSFVAITANSGSLPFGNYSGTIVISGGGFSITVTINFKFQGNPVTAAPQVFALNVLAGRQSSIQDIGLGYVGTANVTITGDSNLIILQKNGNQRSPITGAITVPNIISVSVDAASLPAGPTTRNIAVQCNDNSCFDVAIGIQVNVLPGATLSANPSPVTFAAYQGRTNPQPKTLAITSSDGSAIVFTVSGAPSWLNVSPLAGTTGQSSATLTLTANANGLPVGTNSATLTITPNNGAPSINASVSLIVSAFSISATPSPLTISVGSGQTQSAQLSVGTVDSNSALVNASTSGSVQLSVSSSSFTAPGSVSVSANATGLNAGPYNGTVTLACAAANPCTSVQVPVQVTVTTGPQTPTIKPGGVVPVFSAVPSIQPGEWVSIFGNNLAGGTTVWNGDFPTSLGGTSVTINGKPAYLWLVSAGQLNLQAPDDNATGSVPVVVTTPNGTATSTVTLSQFGPSFSLLDGRHITGIIPRSNGTGAFGAGSNSYDIIGPAGTSLGYPTVPARAGEVVVLFGVGFGTTNPSVPAGRVFSGAAATTNTVNILINNIGVRPVFAGLTAAGLYQFNLTVPGGLGTGEVPIQAAVSGVQTPANVVITLQ